jgi:hypothetical protein
MEQRQLFRNLFYKMWELGITKANVFKMYDKVDKTSFGVYREDRSFKPAGELIAQIFSGASWDTIPIIGNWHMELDDRLNWLNLWKPDTSCDTSTCDTCGSIQPSCWRHIIWEGTDDEITFAWDTTKNHTDSTALQNFNERASLKIIMEPDISDELEASWYFRCCEGGEKQHTAVAPGVSYTCSAYVWTQGDPYEVGLGIRWYDVNGDSISTSYTYISGNTFSGSQWDVLTYTDESPSAAYSCIVSCNVKTTEACTVWIDDAQLYEPLKWKTYYPDSVVVDTGSIAWESIDWQEVEDSLSTDDGRYLTIEAESTGVHWKTDWYGEFKIIEEPDDVKRLWVGYDGHYSTGDTANPKVQRIYLRNWSTTPPSWDQLCATSENESCRNLIRRADITHGWSTASTDSIQDYIDPDGYIWLRVVTKDTVATYDCRADHMRATTQSSQ